MHRHKPKLRLNAETLRTLDLAEVRGGAYPLSCPTDEMGQCSGCATVYCTHNITACETNRTCW